MFTNVEQTRLEKQIPHNQRSQKINKERKNKCGRDRRDRKFAAEQKDVDRGTTLHSRLLRLIVTGFVVRWRWRQTSSRRFHSWWIWRSRQVSSDPIRSASLDPLPDSLILVRPFVPFLHHLTTISCSFFRVTHWIELTHHTKKKSPSIFGKVFRTHFHTPSACLCERGRERLTELEDDFSFLFLLRFSVVAVAAGGFSLSVHFFHVINNKQKLANWKHWVYCLLLWPRKRSACPFLQGIRS